MRSSTACVWGSVMLTPKRIRELFIYEPDTGNLVWLVTKSSKAPRGSVAGSAGSKGHIYIQVDYTMYAAHQIVYLLHHGFIPDEIDHIDQDKTNNRIENLRACTSSQNKGNIGLLRNNRTGYRGVSMNGRSGFYHAQIKIHGKQTYLGRFSTPEEAALRYNEAAREHFGEFAYLNEVLPEWLR